MRRRAANAIIPALFATVAIAGIGLTVIKAIQESRSLEHYNRVKAAISEHEKSIRRALLSSGAYKPCQPGDPPTCFRRIDTSIHALELRPILGCAGASQCGSQPVIAQPFITAARNITFNMSYTGTEPGSSIKPYDSPMTIPESIFQDTPLCDHTNPIFAGYNSDGSKICLPVNKCLPGEFLQNIDAGSLALTCQNLGAAAVTCGPTQVISTITWGSSSSAHAVVTCKDRADAPNGAPTVTIVPNVKSINLPNKVLGASYTVTATDDGYPNPPGVLTYSWGAQAGVSYTNANISNPDITFTTVGVHALTLTVSDSLKTGTATLTVTVSPNAKPTVALGAPKTITLPTTSVLANGNVVTDADGPAPLNCTWTKTGGPAPVPTFVPANGTSCAGGAANPTIGNLTVAGTYTFSLKACDGAGGGGCTTISPYTITVVAGPPLCFAGAPKIVTAGTNLTINDSSNSGGNPPLTQSWARTLGPFPTYIAPSTSATLKPTLKFTASGTATMVLTCSDSLGKTATSTTTITVNVAPTPVANCNNVTAQTGTPINMSASVTGGTPPYTYSWTGGGPGTITPALPSTAFIPNLTFGSDGAYNLTFKVTDSLAKFDTDTCVITSSSGPPGDPIDPDCGSCDGTTNPLTCFSCDYSGSTDNDCYQCNQATSLWESIGQCQKGMKFCP